MYSGVYTSHVQGMHHPPDDFFGIVFIYVAYSWINVFNSHKATLDQVIFKQRKTVHIAQRAEGYGDEQELNSNGPVAS